MMQSSANVFAIAVLAAWVPAIFLLFGLFSPRRAVIAAFIVGYLFLPEVSFSFHTLPEVSKVSLTAVGVVLASFVFDGGRLLTVRPRLIDLPWLVLCLSPIATSLLNDLGIMDGLSGSVNRIFTWGLAYWIGRAYFTDWEAVRELAMGIVWGGLAYVPLCWWEIRMSPQLHGQIYGVTFNSFRRDSGLFGFRPNVFLGNGLTVTMYMGISALLAFWGWVTGSPKRLAYVSMGVVTAILVVTTVFCKALGGLVLMTGGMGALMMTRWARTKIPVLCIILAAPIYVAVRSTGDWSGQRLVEAASAVSQVRADSLEFRLKNENLLAAKALQQPWFGWGAWNRSHVYDPDTGRDLTVTDGLWIILLGEYGFVGLAALMIMVLGASFLLWYRIPVKYWSDPACAAAVSLAVVIALYMVDGLFNATFNPVASLAVGAVASISSTAATAFSRKPLRRPQAAPAVVSTIQDIPYAYSPHRS